MRLQRRHAFAAPFVVVIACTEPRAPLHDPVPPPPPRADETTREPPRDTGVADDPDPYAGMPIEERCRRDPQLHCNPPRPPRPRPPRPAIPACGAGLSCNPPPPAGARVIGASVDGPYTVIVVARGSRDGLTSAWHGCLVRRLDAATCVQGGELTILKIDPNVTRARLRVTRDQVFAAPYVRFTPP